LVVITMLSARLWCFCE